MSKNQFATIKPPTVSIIVPTRNSAATLEACLVSIARQTYLQIEVIVVDRDSTDNTQAIALRMGAHLHIHGPERSAQRNFGVAQATGEYVAIIDSDMELTPDVIAQCVQVATANPTPAGVIIPEESFGQGFWAQCKRLERSFYIGIPWIEAARFFSRTLYQDLGGYDESLVAGEDWDLSHRAEARGPLAHITAPIRHNEGRLRLWKTLQKKYYYAGHARAYLAKTTDHSTLTAQAGPLQRYRLFFSQPARLFRNPFLGLGMLFLKTAEFAAGAIGYLNSPQAPQKANK